MLEDWDYQEGRMKIHKAPDPGPRYQPCLLARISKGPSVKSGSLSMRGIEVHAGKLTEDLSRGS